MLRKSLTKVRSQFHNINEHAFVFSILLFLRFLDDLFSVD